MGRDRVRRILSAAVTLALVGLSGPLSAQASDENGRTPRLADRRIYAGMWTVHFRDLERGLDSNWLVGVSVGTVYGATFINSYGRRAYSAGLQHGAKVFTAEPLAVRAGLRAGIVTGYDERFLAIAGRTPVIPVVQGILSVERSGTGFEFSYSGIIASAALTARF